MQERAGLVDERGHPLLSFHGLRHSRASIALAAGVPLIVVSKQLGHSRIDTTASTYAHLIEDGQLDAFASPFRHELAREAVEELSE